MAKAKKPKRIVSRRDCCDFAECSDPDIRFANPEIVVVWSMRTASEARRLAAWLVRAARWIEEQGE